MRSTLRFRQAGVQSSSGSPGVDTDAGTWCAPIRDSIPPSLYSAGLEEALRHKWIESQKHGCDLGEAALKDWFRRHWLPFCRAKRLEHVEGLRQWHEFAEHEFGQVYELIVQEEVLCDRILDRMEHGYDNFEIINWGLSWGLPMERVRSLLEMIDINRARLEPLAFG